MKSSEYIISSDTKIKDALTQLNKHSGSILTLFIVNSDHQILGSLTDGDIRRGIIAGAKVNDPVTDIMFTKFKFIYEDEINLKLNDFNANQVKLLPVVNRDKKLIDIINLLEVESKLPVQAFILAGGKGKRLRPLTENTPKPLLKVGDKPIIEHNIDRLIKKGVKNYHISIKYLGDQLKDFFKDGSQKKVSIDYIEENEPLGTIGSLSLIDQFEEEVVLVMNSDLLTNIDYEDMYNDFVKSNSDLMVATIPYKVNIPYAVLETNDGQVSSFKEKPTYTYHSNAGIYLIKTEIVDLIPKNEFFNATDLMEKMIELGKKVNYYPILGYWLDIGKHEDFVKAQEDIKHLKL